MQCLYAFVDLRRRQTHLLRYAIDIRDSADTLEFKPRPVPKPVRIPAISHLRRCTHNIPT